MSKSAEIGKHSLVIQFCRFFTFGFCISGFAWLCWGQIEKFLSRKTTVTVSWSKSQKLNFPLVVFCALESFNDSQNYPTFISEGTIIHYISRNLLRCYHIYTYRGRYSISNINHLPTNVKNLVHQSFLLLHCAQKLGAFIAHSPWLRETRIKKFCPRLD